MKSVGSISGGTYLVRDGVLLRRPQKALHYGFRRTLDAWAGRRDGVVDFRALNPQVDGASLDDAVAASHKWLARNAATFEERDHQEFLEAQAAVANLRSDLAVLASAVRFAEAERQRLLVVRESMPIEPSAEALAIRGPAEAADSAVVIEMRRRTEHQRKFEKADGALAQMAGHLVELEEKRSRVVSRLIEVFEAQVTRSALLRAFHMRRQEVYLRGLRRVIVRRHPDPATLILVAPDIPVPAWTQQPCPWIPDDLAARRLVSSGQ